MLPYVVKIRREIHEYPEVGFDLPRTLAVVRRELTAMGIEFTEKYGKSSIVATINPEKDQFTIGIRADMDALPITEATDVEYKSKIDGQMHACGHDAHTAILLDTARQLVEIKDQIACRVKLVFQPAEEFAPSGAKLMAEDGVMDDIDCIIGLHMQMANRAGKIALATGAVTAVSNGFSLDFYGKSAHAAHQYKGVDAIMMAVKAYTAIEMMVAKEVPPKEPVIFNVGAFHGGEANNCVCDYATMFCTLRSWDEALDAKIIDRIKRIGNAVAEESGGRFEFVQKKYYPILVNNDKMVELLKKSASAVIGEENVRPRNQGMGGEDFSFFARRKPAVMFHLGAYNKEKNCTYSTHNDRFNIDEDALPYGSAIFVRFVLDNMNGIEF